MLLTNELWPSPVSPCEVLVNDGVSCRRFTTDKEPIDAHQGEDAIFTWADFLKHKHTKHVDSASETARIGWHYKISACF